MANYEVKDTVCDYGVYENGELKLILNSRRIALQIVELLKEDERIHRELNSVKDYPPYLDRPKYTLTPEKQIPQKPIEDGYYDLPFVCPCCGQALDFTEYLTEKGGECNA